MKKLIMLVLLCVLIGIGGWYFGVLSLVEEYTQPAPFTLDEGDRIQSWNFQSSHNDDGNLEARVRQEITRLESLVGKNEPESPDYQLYVGISNQYTLVGEGKEAYEYLIRALRIDPEKTGLAWHNMGTLMQRLGANNSARVAYAKAVEAQPQVDAYHVARLQFLTNHFADDSAAIEGAFTEAEERFGAAPFLLTIKADWLERTGKIAEAISALERMRALIPEEERESLDRKIARLKGQL